jgi:alpha-tubulin suppressor-like RCC1 family protein
MIPFFSWLALANDGIAIDRKNRTNAVQAIRYATDSATEVMALRGKHIVSVGAGSVHTCFLDAQGGLYSTGKSEYAGHGALGDVHVPTYLNHAFVDDGTDTPATNTHNGGQRKHGAVVSMSVGPGGYHSIILTADNHIYCWGKFWVL